MLGLMVQGQPALHLLPHPQQSSQQQQQQQQRQAAPLQQNGSYPAQELQRGQQPAPLQQQQDVVLAANQSPGGRRNMSWSEVTFVSPS